MSVQWYVPGQQRVKVPSTLDCLDLLGVPRTDRDQSVSCGNAALHGPQQPVRSQGVTGICWSHREAALQLGQNDQQTYHSLVISTSKHKQSRWPTWPSTSHTCLSNHSRIEIPCGGHGTGLGPSMPGNRVQTELLIIMPLPVHHVSLERLQRQKKSDIEAYYCHRSDMVTSR